MFVERYKNQSYLQRGKRGIGSCEVPDKMDKRYGWGFEDGIFW
jgi:hypothetical protein